MSRRTKTLAVLLSSAALIGGGAAGVAQAHHGHGDRGGHSGKRHHKHFKGFNRLASELGVTRAQLKAAFAAVADQRPDFKAVREQFWADFASGLGVSPETLQAAIQKVREEKAFKHHGDGFTEALAAELGVEPAKVTEAWQAATQAAKEKLAAQRNAWVAALAAQLGVDKEKVAAALHECGGANRFARSH
jgi:hypothetical protein